MKKIHITEAQLKALKKKITEQNSYTIDLTKDIEVAKGNVNTAISTLSTTNPQQSNDLKSGKATATFNADAIVSEDMNEFFDKDLPKNYEDEVNSLGTDEYDVYNYLCDMKGTPQLYDLLKDFEESPYEDRKGMVQDLAQQLEVSKQSVYNAIRQFRNEMRNEPTEYEDVMEGKLYIKKQVKEARNRFRPSWDTSLPEYGDIDYDYSGDENYDEMLTALEDFANDPRYQDIFYNALDNGRNEDVHELLDLINNTCDFNIHPNALRQALRNYNSEHHYDNVMEGKLYTKKQIKEARLEKLKKNCKVIKKKEI